PVGVAAETFSGAETTFSGAETVRGAGPLRGAEAGGAVWGGARRDGLARRGGSSGGGGRGGGVGELGRSVGVTRQRASDQAAQAGLELFLDELVGRRDERRVLNQAERPGQPQPGPLVWLDLNIREFLKGPRPYLPQVRLAHRVFTSAPTCESTVLSTGCAH